MSLPRFSEIFFLPTTELSDLIVKIENDLLMLRFKKATRQQFRAHEIKKKKRRIAQLQTLLASRLQNVN